MFVKYFIWFSYVFLSFLFCFSFLFCLENFKKKIQRTLSVLFVILFCFWKMFCGNWTRRRSSFGWWSLDFSILDSRSGSGWESADTKRTPRANETQCEQQVRVQMRPQLEATRGSCPCNTNMFERVARYTVTPLLPALLTRLWLLFATLLGVCEESERDSGWDDLEGEALRVVLGVLSESLMRG